MEKPQKTLKIFNISLDSQVFIIDLLSDILNTAVLYDQMCKNSEFFWTKKYQDAFDILKKSFCNANILRNFDPMLETILETDASDYSASRILSQKFLTD
jgi:hypothetical protein